VAEELARKLNATVRAFRTEVKPGRAADEGVLVITRR
jgi:hypothetical protein